MGGGGFKGLEGIVDAPFNLFLPLYLLVILTRVVSEALKQ